MNPSFHRYLVVLVAFLLLASSGTTTEKRTPFPRRNPIVEAVAKTRDSIVTIKVARSGAKDMVGSGIVIDERGFIVTNRHVVGSNRTVKVILAGGKETVGTVVAAETSLDLAIVRILPPRPLQALTLAPHNDLMVGETVIAIGSPFGYQNTVSTGIISALEREITMPSGDVLAGLIQTNASINPGNSGGPLLNINGELIGINTALREGAQGIAFAINTGTVKQVLTKHLSAVRVAGVSHGLQCQEKVVGETGPRQRLVAAAAAAEVKTGDEILTVAGWEVANSFDIERAFWDKKPGEKVAVKVLRQGQELTVQLTLQAGHGAGPAATSVGGLGPIRSSVPNSAVTPASRP